MTNAIDAKSTAEPHEIDNAELARLPRNDLGLIERLQRRFGDVIAYIIGRGWAAWRGDIWVTGEEGELLAREYAQRTTAALKEEQKAIESQLDDQERRLFDQFVRNAGNSRCTDSILRQAQVPLRRKLEEFDADTGRICLRDGTLTIRLISYPSLVARFPDSRETRSLPLSKLKRNSAYETVGGWTVHVYNTDQIKIARPYPQDHESLSFAPGELDALKITSPSGTLTYERRHVSVKFEPHDKSHRITRMANVDYEAEATTFYWQRHLQRMFEDARSEAFFQRALGAALIGETDHRSFCILQGRGGEGKTTAMQTLRTLLGSYAAISPPATWMMTRPRSGADPTPNLAALAGDTRLVISEEPPQGSALDEALIKQITGGERISVRDLYGKLFQFMPRFLLILVCNQRPEVRNGGVGFWHRVRIMRARDSIAVGKRKPQAEIRQQFNSERSGILNYLIDGAISYLTDGLEATDEMRTEIDVWQSAGTSVHAWANDCTERKIGAATTFKALYQSYSNWCTLREVPRENRIRETAFGGHLEDLGYARKIVNGRNMHRDVIFSGDLANRLERSPANAPNKG